VLKNAKGTHQVGLSEYSTN